jgi:hypothetical protein
MAKGYSNGLYFVIAMDDNTGLVVEWKSERDRPQANLKKVAFESTKGLETCTVRIEFKMAAQVPDFTKALERMKSKAQKA